MNKRNEEIIKLTVVLDECGYEVVEIKPQYDRYVEGVGSLFPRDTIFLRIAPKVEDDT